MRQQRSDGFIEQTLGTTNWVMLALSVITVMFFLLSNVSKCEATEFCATTIFFQVFLGSGVMLLFLWILSDRVSPLRNVRRRLRGQNEVKLFFMQDFTPKKLFYVLPGFGGVMVSSLLISALPLYIEPGKNIAPFVSIFVSGMIMLWCFYQTHAIGIPIIIHGMYNSVVYLIRSSQGGLSSIGGFPIDVPQVGISIDIFGKAISEVIFQLTLVASSEEFFKVFLIAFIVTSAEGGFHGSKKVKWGAGVASVLAWTVYHGIQAIK